MEEEWRLCLEGQYEVSNFGRFRNPRTSNVLNTDGFGGYRLACVNVNGKSKGAKISRLVAQAFIPNPNNLPVVNHIDGDKSNDHVSNLEWVSYAENSRHAHRTGLKRKRFGQQSGNALLTNEQRVEIVRHLQAGTLNHTQAAEKYGVSRPTITTMLRRMETDPENRAFYENLGMDCSKNWPVKRMSCWDTRPRSSTKLKEAQIK